jgi:hypothetical protein
MRRRDAAKSGLDASATGCMALVRKPPLSGRTALSDSGRTNHEVLHWTSSVPWGVRAAGPEGLWARDGTLSHSHDSRLRHRRPKDPGGSRPGTAPVTWTGATPALAVLTPSRGPGPLVQAPSHDSDSRIEIRRSLRLRQRACSATGSFAGLAALQRPLALAAARPVAAAAPLSANHCHWHCPI